MSEILLPMFFSRVFMILQLTFKSFIHFQFVLVNGVQTNGTEKQPQNKPTPLRSINFGKGGKNIQQRKDSPINKQCWGNCTGTCKKKKRKETRPPTYFFLFFQIQFIFNIILCQFQVYNILVRQSYTLQSVSLDIPSIQLTSYIVITILLTIFLYAVRYIPMTIL